VKDKSLSLCAAAGGGTGETMLKEFKKFALKGNMIDLAVGIIIGGAFNGIVNSLVNDIIMPLLSLLTDTIDFTNWFIALNGKSYATLEAAKADGASTVNYGLFLSGLLNFIIMAFVVFLIVKWLNKWKKPETSGPASKKCPHCYSDININATKCPHCTADISEEEQ
jgi:large conductance mechanosensitive channel